MREQDQAAESQLAREARTTGDALAKLVDLARITGNKPDGYTLDDLEVIADTLQGWAFRMAMGLDDDGALFSEFTGRTWIRMDSRQEIHAEPLVDDDGDDGPDQPNPKAP